jgi:hypothetical protein
MEQGKGSKTVDFRIRVGMPSESIPFAAKSVNKY